ncbi:hypothetical protein HGM15179_021182 [Zosterops borbonicus]|uniref:Uncharacterized protein n=1 Tax=Zosterops borbonicus TaxID=364589 RepID=A0A8K1D4Y1_9PASS|nr:hypothetical protein HGM15179_021182 [Zosterops borbonicus]
MLAQAWSEWGGAQATVSMASETGQPLEASREGTPPRAVQGWRKQDRSRQGHIKQGKQGWDVARAESFSKEPPLHGRRRRAQPLQ